MKVYDITSPLYEANSRLRLSRYQQPKWWAGERWVALTEDAGHFMRWWYGFKYSLRGFAVADRDVLFGDGDAFGVTSVDTDCGRLVVSSPIPYYGPAEYPKPSRVAIANPDFTRAKTGDPNPSRETSAEPFRRQVAGLNQNYRNYAPPAGIEINTNGETVIRGADAWDDLVRAAVSQGWTGRGDAVVNGRTWRIGDRIAVEVISDKSPKAQLI